MPSRWCPRCAKHVLPLRDGASCQWCDAQAYPVMPEPMTHTLDRAHAATLIQHLATRKDPAA